MATSTTLNEKGDSSSGPYLTITTSPVAKPDATLSDGISSARTSTYKKSEELVRGSTLSTPRSYQGGNPFDTDIEAIIPTATSSNENCARKSTTNGDCQVWPGKDHWKQKAKAAKINNRSCTCMARLSKRTRLVVKILIGLLIVGIAVGVGFGVSKPLGAPIWGKPNDQK